MAQMVETVIRFLTVDIWRLSADNTTRMHYLGISSLKRLILAVKFFIDRAVIDAAAALTYSTLLAIVPILAVVFAIARGFGFSKYIEEWFLDALSSQPQAAEIIVGFVNSYLVHTHSGVILGIGLVFMLWTVLMLIHNIEDTFNKIWLVEQPRSWVRKVSDYLAMFLLAPIVIVLTSGISIFMATIAKQMEEYMLLGPMVRFLIQLMPYVIMSAVFIGLYIFMPNTKVRFKDAILPGILAGVAMQLLQYFYIHCQIFLSGYNAIYGSFAALPLFMLWVQLSWVICLFGAELTYTSQNLEEFAFLARTEELSHRNYMLISALIMNKICVRFKEGKKPYTAYKLKKDTGIPIRIIKEILHELVQVRILSVTSMDKNQDVTYQPYTSLDHLTVGMLFDKLEANGKWTIDIDLRKLELQGGWKNILMASHDYFKALKNIPLTDL